MADAVPSAIENRPSGIHRFLRRAALAALALLLAGPGLWTLWGRPANPPRSMHCRVEKVWGLRGGQPGQLQSPRAVLPAPGSSLYVIDRSGRIQRFSRDGRLLAAWRLPAWRNGTPTGLCLDGQGRLVVANCHYADILIYAPDGTLERQFGEYGQEPGQMIYPTDVALGPDGAIYVSERGGRDRIQKFDSQGAFLMEWGGFGAEPGRFERPMGLAFDDRARLWVADSGNHRLQVFDAQGNLIQALGKRGAGPGELCYPYDVACAPGGRMVVAEYGNNRLQVFSSDFASLGCLGGPGAEPGRFASPWGVACDELGTIWVADTLNHRIQALALD